MRFALPKMFSNGGRVEATEVPSRILEAQFAGPANEPQVLQHELEIARQIQQSLLPKTFPHLPGFGLAGFCRSARYVGGDFFDVVSLDERGALLVVADVMGKGVPAALFATTFRTLVRTMAPSATGPGELLARLNRMMFEELSSVDMFITAQFGMVDAVRRQLTIASAGHCPLLLCGPDGEARAFSPEGLPLGIQPEALFIETVVSVEPSTCALMFTDGLTEACNLTGICFGQQRLENWLRLSAGFSRSAAQLKDELIAQLGQFQSGFPLVDDQTFLILTSEHNQAASLASPQLTVPDQRALSTQHLSLLPPARPGNPEPERF